MNGRERVVAAIDATRASTPAERDPRPPTDPWTPSLELDGDTGVLTTGRLIDEHPDWDAIFRHWNLDPDAWRVVGDLRVNAWEGPTADGGTVIYRQYKAQLRRRTSDTPRWDADETLMALARWRPPRRKPVTGHGPAWVVNCADWQVAGHGGSAAFMDRFDAAMADLTEAARAHRKAGVTDLVVGFLGDMAEGATGNYPGQEFEVDLDRNDQTRLVAGCELVVLRELAPLFARTTAVAVPGNHSRNATDYATGEHDVADLTSFRWAASMLTYAGEAEQWGIEFVMPERADGTLMARVEAAGTRLLYAHGHKTRGSADKLRAWWRDVSFSRWGDADATDHLITGHRHHVHIEECSRDRWLFVCPTLGGRSDWFHEGGGPTSGHGVLHFTTLDRAVRDVNVAGAGGPESRGG
jgi:predicted phosphodiesterase